MLKLLLWPGFILLALAQWCIPLQMIWKKEKVLSNGVLYKFETAPVDPNDPFRGKYIVLNYRENAYKIKADSTLAHGSTVYLTFFTNKNGFAAIKTLSTSKPPGSDFLETGVSYAFTENDSTNVFVDYPFKSYYMDEYKAPQAERIYNESRLDSTQKTYALVSILNGDAVVKDVFINDSSILQVIRERNRVRPAVDPANK